MRARCAYMCALAAGRAPTLSLLCNELYARRRRLLLLLPILLLYTLHTVRARPLFPVRASMRCRPNLPVYDCEHARARERPSERLINESWRTIAPFIQLRPPYDYSALTSAR